MATLEEVEWCEFRWDRPGESQLPRVLLVGDSIAKGYRPVVSSLLAGTCFVDQLATSRAVDNPDLLREIDYALAKGEYRLIHFNNGLHGFHLSPEDYQSHMSEVLSRLSQGLSESRVIVATTTPVTEVGNPQTLDAVRNQSVQERNGRLIELARLRGLRVNSLYSMVIERPLLCLGDGYHYNDLGQDVLGKAVAQQVRQLLSENGDLQTT